MNRTYLMTLRGDNSRKVIAEKLNITTQMLGAIERGDRTPSLILAKRIADHYGVYIEDIFFNLKGNETCPLDKED